MIGPRASPTGRPPLLLALLAALALLARSAAVLEDLDLLSLSAMGVVEEAALLRSQFADYSTFLQNMLYLPTERECYNTSGFRYPNRCPSMSTGPRRMVFLKTHKTGSSTVSGIIWRELCLQRHMNCFLPGPLQPGRTWDVSIPSEMAYAQKVCGTNLTEGPFDIWLHHAVHNEQLHSIVVQPHLVMSIVRKPVRRFQSSWNYFSQGSRPGSSREELTSLLEARVRRGNLADFSNTPPSELFKYYHPERGLESMSQELTGKEIYSEAFNASFFRDLLPRVFSFKLFLMVCDRFDESLLIVRWIGRWVLSGGEGVNYHLNSTHPVVPSVGPLSDSELWYVAQKVQNASSDSVEVFSSEQQALLEIAQPHDALLFRIANHALDLLIDFYGRAQFSDDLARFQRHLRTIQAYCKTFVVEPACTKERDRAVVGMLRSSLESPECTTFVLHRAEHILTPVPKYLRGPARNNSITRDTARGSRGKFLVFGYAHAQLLLPAPLRTCWNMQLDNVQFVNLFWRQLLRKSEAQLDGEPTVDMELLSSLSRSFSVGCDVPRDTLVQLLTAAEAKSAAANKFTLASQAKAEAQKVAAEAVQANLVMKRTAAARDAEVEAAMSTANSTESANITATKVAAAEKIAAEALAAAQKLEAAAKDAAVAAAAAEANALELEDADVAKARSVAILSSLNILCRVQ